MDAAAHLNAKSARLDVNIIFNDGEAADLEMQIGKSDDDLGARAALYAAMLLSAQSKKGHPYKEIKRVYQIFFLNCILYPQSKKLPELKALLSDHKLRKPRKLEIPESHGELPFLRVYETNALYGQIA